MNVLLSISGAAAGTELLRGFAGLGSRALLITDQESSVEREVCIKASFRSRALVEQAFTQAAHRAGVPDLIVHAAIPQRSLQSRPVEAVTQLEWASACHAAMKATLYCLQASFTQLSAKGGAIVLIGPSLSLVGATGLVPLTTAVEGQRALGKSAARQWGRAGITVNWVFVRSQTLFPSLASAAIPTGPELGPPPLPLGAAPDLADIPAAIAFFGSAAGRKITGTMLAADGGEWMVP